MNSFENSLVDCLGLLESLRGTADQLQAAAETCVATLERGGKILICGNGGSAAEAQHLAAELAGKYKTPRPPLAGLALASDAAVLTCIGNDYSFEDVFSRQVRALGRPGDILIAYSTSGQSANIVEALIAARDCAVTSVLFSGRNGGRARSLADLALVVTHEDTARIQEAHHFLTHCLVEFIERGLGV